MRWILDWHGRASSGTIATARTSQALVIEAADRLVQLTSHQTTVKRLLTMQLDAMDTVLGDHAQLVEQSYDTLQRMVALHREFAGRLFEAIDKRDDGTLAGVTPHEHLATVHTLRTGGHSA
jgi:hypothetical protein